VEPEEKEIGTPNQPEEEQNNGYRDKQGTGYKL